MSKYPDIRHLTSYETALSILEKGNIYSRNELKTKIDELDNNIITNEKLSKDTNWYEDRSEKEIELYNTNNIIYCTPDYYKDYGHITGHGPVMFYFKEEIFNDFDITLTITDSLANEYESGIFNKDQISQIYEDIMNNNETEITKEILANIDITNEAATFRTINGFMEIEGGLYHNLYSEIQIHAKEIPLSYIAEIKFTETYLHKRDTDQEYYDKIKELLKETNFQK